MNGARRYSVVVRLSKVQSTGQYDLDGTYLKQLRENKSIRLPDFIKGIAYSDEDNSYHPIAIQHDTVEESEEGYKQLLENLWREFPHTITAENAYGCDHDSGLVAFVKHCRESGQPTPHFVYCTVHIKRNVQNKYDGKKNEKKEKQSNSIGFI